jgi:hypothetical protein
MSRENRVNPGTYTQAGRLTPDDTARELVKQRQSMSNSQGSGNPKDRSEAWMHQAEQARELATAPEPAVSTPWLERVSTGLSSLSVAVGALGLLAGRQLSRAPQLRDREAVVRKTALVVANTAAICLSLYVARRLATAAMARRAPGTSPATNHTPGRPYAYGI